MLIRNFVIFALLQFANINLYSKDSTKYVNISFGTYSYAFNRDIQSEFANTTFLYQSSKTFDYAFGLKVGKGITERKDIVSSLLYSNATMSYLHSIKNPPFSPTQTRGNINIKGILLSGMVNWRAFKWLKLNYGLNSYFLIKNTFDNTDIAQSIDWYDKNNKSNMKNVVISLCIGLEIRIYKRFSIEYNHMEGLNNFIVLNVKDDPYLYKTPFPQKLKYGGLTLNYRLK